MPSTMKAPLPVRVTEFVVAPEPVVVSDASQITVDVAGSPLDCPIDRPLSYVSAATDVSGSRVSTMQNISMSANTLFATFLSDIAYSLDSFIGYGIKRVHGIELSPLETVYGSV